MKNPFRSKLLSALFFVTFALGSCDQDEASSVNRAGNITFSFDKKDDPSGRISNSKVKAIFLNIEDALGNVVFENKKLGLLEFGEGHVTESISLNIGSYALTSFIVVDENDKALYATPHEGSEKADYVNHALPMQFTVGENISNVIRPQVLQVNSSDSPESFGYTSFDFEIVDGGETMPINIKVELKVGDVMYLDVDTKIIVKGYNAGNESLYHDEFAYVGPYNNSFPVKTGFHHYSFEVNHFGVYDKQIISGENLLQGSKGQVPTTYVLGGATVAKKLAYHIYYAEHPDPTEWGNTIMVPESKVSYQYNAAGKLERMTFYTYANGNEVTEDRYFTFAYVNERLDKISGYTAANQKRYIEDLYSYHPDGNVSKIVEKNQTIGITSEMNVSYNFTDRLIKATYANSNGTGFQYEFFYNWKNRLTDKVSRWNETCSEGNYTYDKNINPLKHLGYTDFLFSNYSANNKIAENVNYLACGFPSLIPESYEYEYDALGYPTVATTHYKSRTFKTQTLYYYTY